jgi:hypothetical protein
MKSVNPHGISTSNLNVAILHNTRLRLDQVERLHQSAAMCLLASRVETRDDGSWQVQSSQNSRVWYRVVLWEASHPIGNSQGMLLTCNCDYSSDRICHHRYAVILFEGDDLCVDFIDSLPRTLRGPPPALPLLRPSYCAKRGRKKKQRTRPTKSSRPLSPQRQELSDSDSSSESDSSTSSSPSSSSSTSSRPTWSPFRMDGSIVLCFWVAQRCFLKKKLIFFQIWTLTTTLMRIPFHPK